LAFRNRPNRREDKATRGKRKAFIPPEPPEPPEPPDLSVQGITCLTKSFKPGGAEPKGVTLKYVTGNLPPIQTASNPAMAATSFPLSKSLPPILSPIDRFVSRYATIREKQGRSITEGELWKGEDGRFNVEQFAANLAFDIPFVEATLRGVSMRLRRVDLSQPLHQISVPLERDMQDKYHHTKFHGLMMGLSGVSSMDKIAPNKSFLKGLAALIGAGHDLIQNKGPKDNEFESAAHVMSFIEDMPSYQGLSTDQKDAVFLLTFHAICSFTTLNFPTLKTVGENVLEGMRLSRGTLLGDFGKALSHNDLFSKIEYLGERRVFESVVETECRMGDTQYKQAVLLSQMFQMSAEFNVPQVLVIRDALSGNSGVTNVDIKNSLKLMVGLETDPERGFWRAGMPPCEEMTRQLGIDGRALQEILLLSLDDPKFSETTFRLLQAFKTSELRNPSFDRLSGGRSNRK